jgi:hypothetical protein
MDGTLNLLVSYLLILQWTENFSYPLKNQIVIVLCVKKRNYLYIGHFTTLSGHFFANYINIFHKIELQMVILMCPTCQNLIGIKSCYIKHNFLFFANFKKNTENLWHINGHFRTISGHLLANHIIIFYETEVQTVILSCLVYLNPNWIKSYKIILVKIKKYSSLKMHYFMANFPK